MDFSNERFSDYLQLLCDAATPWWKTHAFMDEIDEATWFEFELDSKTQNEPEQLGKKPEEITLRVLKAIDDYDCEKILIVGSPGAGKSTLLSRLLWQAAQKAQEDETAPIPVLVELKLYGEAGIWGLIQTALEDRDLYLEISDIKHLVEHRQLLLLADGFNELPNDRARTEFRKFCGRNISVIVTSRDGMADLGLARKLQLQPLADAKVKAFLQSRLLGHAQRQIEQLGDRVKDLGQTPLMVWMLFSIFQQNGEIPSTRGEAYRAFTTLYAERAKEGIDLDESRFLLSKLAFELMHNQELGEIDAQNLLGSEKALDHLVRNHLLQAPGTLGKRMIRFCHQSLQEYYAAEYLLMQNISDAKLKRDYPNLLKWTEPLAIMLSLVNEKDAVRVVELALEVDWMVGARLAGEVKQEFQEQTVAKVGVLKVPEWLKMELLGETRSKFAVSRIKQYKDFESGFSYLEALAKIDDTKVIEYFLQKFNDVNLFQASSIEQYLIQNFNSKIAEEMISKLESHSSTIRHRAITILTKTDSRLLCQEVESLSKHSDSEIRYDSIKILAYCNDIVSTRVILQLLEDDDLNVQIAAVQALGDLNDQDFANRTLLNILNQAQHHNLKLAAAGTLGKRGNREGLSILLNALDDNCSEVREFAIVALGESAHPDAVIALIPLLESEEFSNDAAMSLIRIGRATSSEILIDYLDDLPLKSRKTILYILGRINDGPALIKLLSESYSTDHTMRMYIATKLGYFRKNTKAHERLLELLHDQNDDVCRYAWLGIKEVNSVSLFREVANSQEIDYKLFKFLATLELKGETPEELVDKIFRNAADSNTAIQLLQEFQGLSEQSNTSGDLESIVEKLGKIKDDRAAHILPNLITLIPTDSGEAALNAIAAIQTNCQFYNYDLFRSDPVPEQTIPGQPIYNFNAPVGIVNAEGTVIHGGQTGINSRNNHLRD
ncbi:NACHT domain-containing protein [Phormidesmis priestleyi]